MGDCGLGRVGNKFEVHRADAQDVIHLAGRGVEVNGDGHVVVREPGLMGGDMEICLAVGWIGPFGISGKLGGLHRRSACDARIFGANTYYDHVAELSVVAVGT